MIPAVSGAEVPVARPQVDGFGPRVIHFDPKRDNSDLWQEIVKQLEILILIYDRPGPDADAILSCAQKMLPGKGRFRYRNLEGRA